MALRFVDDFLNKLEYLHVVSKRAFAGQNRADRLARKRGRGLEFADHRWNPEDLVLNEELGSVVERALAAMSEKLRTVLILHDKEDMGYEEIALTVNVPVGTVKSRLFLARAHMQRWIGDYLGHATGGQLG